MSSVVQPRTVVDTNLLVSALISPHGPPAQLLEAWHQALFHVLTCAPLLAEIEEVLKRDAIRRRFRVRPAEVVQLIERLHQQTEQVTPLPISDLPVRCRDPKDDMLLACALGGRADYLVTGDDDLLVLDGDERLGSLRIVRVAAFLTHIQPVT